MATGLKHLKLSEIRENPSALRAVNRQDPAYLGLVDSIRSRGVMNAIVVRQIPGEDGKPLYGLVDGLHRYTGSLDAGLETIPCQVMAMDDAAVMEAQLIGNVHKVETKPVEYSKHLQKILSISPLLTITQLAGKLNKSSSWLSERLGLIKLSKEVAALVDEGKINLSNAYMLAKLAESEQIAFADRAMTMSPQEFTPTVLARKKELDTAKRQGRDAKPAEFVPIAHLRKVSELRADFDNPKAGPAICQREKLKTAEEGFKMGIAWALHLDPDSVTEAKAKDDVRKKQLEDQKTKAAAERAKKRADEAAEKAAQLQPA